MRALGGVERAWAGARPKPQDTEPAAPSRCEMAGNRIGLVTPLPDRPFSGSCQADEAEDGG